MLDIYDLLKSLITQEIPMRNTGVERDIADFIAGRLREDRRLRKLLPHSEKIEKRLSRDANGVFRWVECQLKSLQSCPRSEYHVDQFLDSLPQGLDETYKRMLCNIEDTLLEDARRIFTLLCFTPRPLSVPELLDGIAVDIKEPKGLNRKRRLQDFDDICDICPGFIEVTNDFNNFGYYREGTRQTVRIAHFSIQEYLESERIQGHKAANYSLNKVAARTEIAEVCLLYLLEEDFYNSVLNRSVFGALPLVEFAAKSWYPCYKDAVVPATRLESLILILFQRPSSFANWAKLHVSLPAIDGFFVPNPILSPIEYAASLGLDRVLSKLLKWEEVNTRSLSLESTESPSILRLALQQASWNGHESTVKILLDAGAKIYAKGDAIYVTALKDASRHDHERVVRMLIEAGTDVSPQNGKFGNELRKASEEGELEVVRALIEAGADINFRSETFGTALTAASYRGHKQVVQTLMKAGADVELQGKFFGSALQIASRFGRKEVVQVLIEAGADLNARNGQSRSALELASDLGHENVVQILKSAGAT